MSAIRLHTVVEKDGEILVTGLPCKKGQHVDMIVQIEPSTPSQKPYMTARQLLHSEIIGLWQNRNNMQLQEQIQRQ